MPAIQVLLYKKGTLSQILNDEQIGEADNGFYGNESVSGIMKIVVLKSFKNRKKGFYIPEILI